MVEEEMMNDMYYYVEAMDHLGVLMVVDQNDNLDWFAIVVMVLLELTMAFVVDNFAAAAVVVVVAAAAAVDVRNHDPRINIYISSDKFEQNKGIIITIKYWLVMHSITPKKTPPSFVTGMRRWGGRSGGTGGGWRMPI